MRASAHPRSRGENFRRAVNAVRNSGSSPLTRGKLSAEKPDFLTGRLIPAHAGKTPGRRGGVPRARAHPRSRGENMMRRRVPANGPGSSPLTRGKHFVNLCIRVCGRLIPAHAGKTRTIAQRSMTLPAHPRSRGENWFCGPWGRVRAGSSPLTRGKPPPPGRYQVVPRLIPAHAGKT